ncbi:hypothetical protein H4R27_005763, partial [Coemansia aciculifera]
MPMKYLSAFQLLPPHVVKLIVDHVVGSSRLRFDGITTDWDEYKLLQMPLLWVCHNFRAFVHQLFCRVYELTLENDRDRAEARLYSWPTCFKELSYLTHFLAKELWVKLDIKSVYSGKALQLLSDAPYEGRSFPLIRKLIFNLTSDSDGNYYWEPLCENEGYYDLEPVHDNGREPESDDLRDDELEPESDDDATPKTHYVYPPDTAANITAFVQRIKRMAPTVSEIDVTPIGDAERLLQRCNIHVSDLVQQLFDIVERRTVITCGSEPMLMCLDLEPIRDLVYMDCSLDTDSKDLLPLIRRSMQTLQFLDLSVGDVETTGAVRDPDSGDYLEYPCLRTLIIRSFHNPWASQEVFVKDIVPFPRLLRLSVLSDYPFGDDILFRGNAATLEYLEVGLLPETVSMLREYRVFTPTSHPNLKCVKLDMPLRRVPDIFAIATEYMQFVLSIGPGASVREIAESAEYPEGHTLALSMLKDHGCIQILSFPLTILSLWEVISLVKSLPLLSDLTTSAPVLGELPQGVNMTMLPGHVRATYAPMGKRFRCWHVHTYYGTEVDYIELATCMLLLALVCPNFDYAAVGRNHREPFMKVMQDKIAEPEFSQDAPRLTRVKPTFRHSCLDLGYRVHRMANELSIHVEERGIYTGAVLRTLSRAYPDDCAFPSVHTFTLLLESYADEDFDGLDDSGESNESVGMGESSESGDKYDMCMANVSAFVLWIKQMLPMVNEVSIKLGRYFDPDNACDRQFTDLVSRLYRLGNRVKYSCDNGRDVPVELGLDEIHDLVHVSFWDKYGSGQFTHLARQNAQMLQSLYLESPCFKGLASLIQNPDGSYATYPCLHTLELQQYSERYGSDRVLFPGAVPFPSLRSLSLRLQYPFGDDALFRGNSATLESLVLQPDGVLVALLREYDVFTPTSHPILRCVKFRGWDRLVPEPLATYAEVIWYALSIGPGAPVREIDGVPFSNNLVRVISSPGDHSSMQVLSIPSTKLDIWQTISLIKSLPLLSDLHALAPSIGSAPDNVRMAELPAYMMSTYAPIGERFRCWHLGYHTGNAECMILLALICPNFDYVAMDQRPR